MELLTSNLSFFKREYGRKGKNLIHDMTTKDMCIFIDNALIQYPFGDEKNKTSNYKHFHETHAFGNNLSSLVNAIKFMHICLYGYTCINMYLDTNDD